MQSEAPVVSQRECTEGPDPQRRRKLTNTSSYASSQLLGVDFVPIILTAIGGIRPGVAAPEAALESTLD
jgi:hypothetical protein